MRYVEAGEEGCGPFVMGGSVWEDLVVAFVRNDEETENKLERKGNCTIVHSKMLIVAFFLREEQKLLPVKPDCLPSDIDATLNVSIAIK
ncbi:hypothetical protein CEXT_9351 [Caerostris extrusa]|uniref:Uncharacterized protein n=1 Tax=Caerostris extrusa TaxID=172846 RepID=A0AAV4V1A1_CAEEX|nr:hypothetical protein CEXT_9351 [Caerostris extrusa]